MLLRVIELSGRDKGCIANELFNTIHSLVEYSLRSKSGKINSGMKDADFLSVVDIDNDPYAYAMQIYDDLQTDMYHLGIQDNSKTYQHLLKCIEFQYDSSSLERRKESMRLFKAACEAGEVSRSVWDQFNNMNSTEFRADELISQDEDVVSRGRNVCSEEQVLFYGK